MLLCPPFRMLTRGTKTIICDGYLLSIIAFGGFQRHFGNTSSGLASLSSKRGAMLVEQYITLETRRHTQLASKDSSTRLKEGSGKEEEHVAWPPTPPKLTATDRCQAKVNSFLKWVLENLCDGPVIRPHPPPPACDLTATSNGTGTIQGGPWPHGCNTIQWHAILSMSLGFQNSTNPTFSEGNLVKWSHYVVLN